MFSRAVLYYLHGQGAIGGFGGGSFAELSVKVVRQIAIQTIGAQQRSDGANAKIPGPDVPPRTEVGEKADADGSGRCEAIVRRFGR